MLYVWGIASGRVRVSSKAMEWKRRNVSGSNSDSEIVKISSFATLVLVSPTMVRPSDVIACVGNHMLASVMRKIFLLVSFIRTSQT